MNKWLGIFIFFLLTNNSKQLLSLINGDFDLEFNKLIDDINDVDSDVFKDACIHGLLENRQMLKDLNMAYKAGGLSMGGEEE